MATKLTLRLDEKLIIKAKKIAGAKGVSLSRLVSDYFRSVAAKEKEEIPESPVLSEIAGILPKNKNGKKLKSAYNKYIEDKYL